MLHTMFSRGLRRALTTRALVLFLMGGVTLVGVAGVCFLKCVAAPAPQPQAPPPPEARPSTAPNTRALVKGVEAIKPGTVVGETAPSGWSHLLLKSYPRLDETEKKKVNGLTASLAQIVTTVSVADVQATQVGNQKKYVLARIGIGIATAIRGRDTIVDPDTHERLGANLGILGAQVLAEVHKKVQEIRLVAVSRTTAIYDTPAFMQKGRGHAEVVLRYAVMVNEDTGQVDTLVWRIDRNGRTYEGTVGPMEWLPPNKIMTTMMRVDLNEFTLGIPSDKAFAILKIPEGKKQLVIPEAIRKIAGQDRLAVDEARLLDGKLRELVK